MRWLWLILLLVPLVAHAYPQTAPGTPRGGIIVKHRDNQQIQAVNYPYIREVLAFADSVTWVPIVPFYVDDGDTLAFRAIRITAICTAGFIETKLVSPSLVDSTTAENDTPSGRGPGNFVRYEAGTALSGEEFPCYVDTLWCRGVGNLYFSGY